MTHELDETRARLAERQREVLGALLAGEVPEGFDPATTRLAARQLVGKRRDEAMKICPKLAELPGWPARFEQYALTVPRSGCAHGDVDQFVSWLASAPEAGDWLAERAVFAGGRRFALVRRKRRRELLVGVGEHVWRLALRKERE